jgi:hypothetical protein
MGQPKMPLVPSSAWYCPVFLAFAGQHADGAGLDAAASHYHVFLMALLFAGLVAARLANGFARGFYFIHMPAIALGLAETFDKTVYRVFFGCTFLCLRFHIAMGGQCVGH